MFLFTTLTLATFGTAGMDAVRPRSVTVIEPRLLNADDRCRLLLQGEPPAVPRVLRDRLVEPPASCLDAAHGGRTDELEQAAAADDDDELHREGDGRRNWCSKIRFSSRTASGGGSSSGR